MDEGWRIVETVDRSQKQICWLYYFNTALGRDFKLYIDNSYHLIERKHRALNIFENTEHFIDELRKRWINGTGKENLTFNLGSLLISGLVPKPLNLNTVFYYENCPLIAQR